MLAREVNNLPYEPCTPVCLLSKAEDQRPKLTLYHIYPLRPPASLFVFVVSNPLVVALHVKRIKENVSIRAFIIPPKQS